MSPAPVTYQFSTVARLPESALTLAATRVGDALENLLRASDGARDVSASGRQARQPHTQRPVRGDSGGVRSDARREPSLRPSLQGGADQLVDLLRPLAGTRERALDACNALIGDVIANLALGTADPETIETGVQWLTGYSDPRRRLHPMPDPF